MEQESFCNVQPQVCGTQSRQRRVRNSSGSCFFRDRNGGSQRPQVGPLQQRPDFQNRVTFLPAVFPSTPKRAAILRLEIPARRGDTMRLTVVGDNGVPVEITPERPQQKKALNLTKIANRLHQISPQSPNRRRPSILRRLVFAWLVTIWLGGIYVLFDTFAEWRVEFVLDELAALADNHREHIIQTGNNQYSDHGSQQHAADCR